MKDQNKHRLNFKQIYSVIIYYDYVGCVPSNKMYNIRELDIEFHFSSPHIHINDIDIDMWHLFVEQQADVDYINFHLIV